MSLPLLIIRLDTLFQSCRQKTRRDCPVQEERIDHKLDNETDALGSRCPAKKGTMELKRRRSTQVKKERKGGTEGQMEKERRVRERVRKRGGGREGGRERP
jgi:hypothetical protein